MEGVVDVVVLGTGLTESITAAALSKAGYKVAHIDLNPYYGADEASLSLDELIEWADQRSSLESKHNNPYLECQKAKFTSISRSASTLSQSRQYAISLAPSLIPSIGPIISSLVASGVARYGGYRLLERVGVYDISGTVKAVPGSKEDVFKDKGISLIDKRRLMRFLMFAAGEFEEKKDLQGQENTPFLEFLQTAFLLNEEIAGIMAYSLAYCVSLSDTTLQALRRIRNYLRSAGRYGASSFLVGHYGGSGEIAQGFCRTAAVAGGIYVLGRRISAITSPEVQLTSAKTFSGSNTQPSRYSVELEDFPEKLTCNLIISSSDHVPPYLLLNAKRIPSSASYSNAQYSSIARCITIIDRPISFSSTSSQPETSSSGVETPEHSYADEAPARQDVDTSVLVFPPSSIPDGSTTTAVHALITGPGCMATPSGKWIVYLSIPLLEPSSSPETVLKPYVDAILSLTTMASSDTPAEPLFWIYYNQNLSPSISSNISPPSSLHIPPTVLITPLPSILLPETSDSAATNAEAVFHEALKSLQPKAESAHVDAQDTVPFWPPIEGDPGEEAEQW